MASSLVEYQEFKHHIFGDANDLQVFEELLGAMELPTPPLSPDHAETADSSQLADTTPEDLDVGESILQQMMASSEDMPFDSQSTYASDSSEVIDVDPNVLLASNPQALLQDCMWNGEEYEPRHSIGCNGVYTPAPSPPPEGKEATEEEEEEDDEQVFDSKDLAEEVDCIIPNEEVLVLVTAEGEGVVVKETCTKVAAVDREPRKPVLGYKKSGSTLSTGNTRLHPQATSSESGKLICSLQNLPQWCAKWC